MKPESKIPSSAPAAPMARRNFLLGATLTGAGAIAAAVAGGSKTEIAETLTGATKPAKTKGYHVTPHIAQYYETTKL
jgi:hypothetical protein